MKKVVKKTTTEKHVTEKTFEKAMVSIAKSFARTEDRFDRIEKNFDRVFGELKNIREDNHDFKNRMLVTEITTLKHDQKIENMLSRIEKVEAKIK